MLRDILSQLAARQALHADEISHVITLIAADKLTDAELAALLMALVVKGVNAAETAAIVQAMRAQAITISPRVNEDLLDTCGTGGGLSTFNISTASAFVCAAAGIPVAKHGSRSLSSLCGSADVLEALGVNINLSPAAVTQQIEQIGIGFLHAPNFHPVMRRILPVEAMLGIKSIFYTLIGPLINPARAQRHLLGLYRPDLLELTAQVLPALGFKEAMLVHGVDGVDEISMLGPTDIRQYQNGALHAYQICPEQFGLIRCTLDDIRSQVPLVSAELIRQLFSGKLRGAHRDAVLLNSAGGLMLAGRAANFSEGIALAGALLDQGKVTAKLSELVQMSQDLASKAHQVPPAAAADPASQIASAMPAALSSNITDAFQALQQSEQNKRARLKTLIETLPDLIWLQDNQGRFINCNSRFERFIGLPEAQLQGLQAEDVLPAPLAGSFHDAAQLAQKENRPVLSQQWISYSGDGHQEYVDIIHTPFLNQHQQLEGVIGIARDVTAFKRTEEELLRHRDQLEFMVEARTTQLSDVIAQLRQAQHQLVEAEKLAALGAIIAGLSHELNTPLGNVLTLGSTLETELQRLQAALTQGTLTRPVLERYISHSQEMVSLLNRAAQRSTDLIADFKQVATDQIAEQRCAFDMAAQVSSRLDELRPALQQAQIQVECQLAAQLICDSFPAVVGKIVTHLLQNVLTHAFNLTAEHPPLRQLTLSLQQHGNQLELQCRDNGIGMSAASLARVFHPFFTLDMSKGAGIGLPVCKRLALSVLGGDLEVSATLGQGCCFVLRMPLIAPGYRSTSADSNAVAGHRV